MKSENQIKQLEQRLAALEAGFNKIQASPNVRTTVEQETTKNFFIRVHFGRVALDRKPFAVTLGITDHTANITRSLTPIRTAILLVLLMDLLERGENDDHKKDNVERVQNALMILSPKEEHEVSSDALRVALYRAAQFLEEEFGSTEDSSVNFGIEKGQLTLLYRGAVVPPAQIEVEITTSDQVISSFLDRSLATSPLARLRKAKALYIPAGEDGQDRLLLELLDHDFPVRQTSLFYRPTVQSFSQELLAKLKVNSTRRKRQDVAIKSYQSGRLQYTEILQRKVLWDMIRRVPGKGFALYPSDASAVEVLEHIDNMLFLVRTMPSYELVLTDAFFPFYITTFEVSRAESIERSVLFFQNAEEDNIRQASVFALKDDAVFFSTHDRIVRWVLSHPTTIRNREHVAIELQAVRNALVESIENPKLMGFNESPMLMGDSLLSENEMLPIGVSQIEVSVEKSQKPVAKLPKSKGKSVGGNQANRRGLSR